MLIFILIFLITVYLILRKNNKIKLPKGKYDLQKALINNVVIREKKRLK